MLVLSRKEGERIMVGDNIAVVINRISGNRVTIGIEAPENVSILRGELDDAKREFREVPTSGMPTSGMPTSGMPARGTPDTGEFSREFHAPLLAFRSAH